MLSRSRLLSIQFLAWGCFLLVSVMAPVDAAAEATTKSDFQRGRIALLAEGRGHPWITMADGRAIENAGWGDSQLQEQLDTTGFRGLSLAAGDFDQDGVTDLVSGYATSVGGLVRIHRGNPDYFNSRLPIKLPGEEEPKPFLPSARHFELSIEPHFLAVGDFDGDDDLDLIIASKNRDFLLCYLGTGNGELKFDQEISVDGQVTELIAADINRKDGLEDIVIGVEGPTGSSIRIYSSYRGALSAEPVNLWLEDPAEDITTGRLDSDHTVDLAVASGNQVLVVKGWDGRPNWLASGTVPVEQVVTHPFTYRVTQVVAGDLAGDTRHDVAALLQTGEVRILEGSEDGLMETLSFMIRDPISMPPARDPSRNLAPRLTKGRSGTLPKDTLILTDPGKEQIRVVLPGQAWFESKVAANAELAFDPKLIDFDYRGTPVAVLPLFLNRDALSDFVVLGADHPGISVTESACSGGFVVNRATDENDANVADGVCDTNLDTPSILECTFKAAMSQANWSPGHDCISFEVPTVPGLHRYPYVEDTVTINGQLPDPDGPPMVVIQGDPAANTMGLAVRTGNCTFDSLKVSGFGKGAISLLREGNNKIQDCDIGEGNLGWGIWVTGVSNSIERTTVKGTVGFGILISGSAVGNNLLLENTVTDNTSSGISVGSVATAEIIDNKIFGSGLHGIWLGTIERETDEGKLIGSTVKKNTIERNKWTGIVVQGVGISILENTIAYNGTDGERGSGIELWGSSGHEKNRIFGNFIFDNVGLPPTSQEYGSKGLGIDIYGDGVTPNDDQKDADSGVNGEQNFPVLIMAADNSSVEVKLHSTPNHEFEIEFFGNQACDPSGYGEGMQPLGTKKVRTGTNGNIEWCEGSCSFPASWPFITATATDQNNNTSEFSKCAEYVDEEGGKVTILGSTVPLPQIEVTITDSKNETHKKITNDQGRYSLELQPGQYTIVAKPSEFRGSLVRAKEEFQLTVEQASDPLPDIEMGVINKSTDLKKPVDELKKFATVVIPGIPNQPYSDEMDQIAAFAATQPIPDDPTDERLYRLFLATFAAQQISRSAADHCAMLSGFVVDIVASFAKFSNLNRLVSNSVSTGVVKAENFIIRKILLKANRIRQWVSKISLRLSARLANLRTWALKALFARADPTSRGAVFHRALVVFLGGTAGNSSLTSAGKLPERYAKSLSKSAGKQLFNSAYADLTDETVQKYIDVGTAFVPKNDNLEDNQRNVFSKIQHSRQESVERLNNSDQSWAAVANDVISAVKDSAGVLEDVLQPIVRFGGPAYAPVIAWTKSFKGALGTLQTVFRGGNVTLLIPALAIQLPNELETTTNTAFDISDTSDLVTSADRSGSRNGYSTSDWIRRHRTFQLALTSTTLSEQWTTVKQLIENEAYDELITHVTEDLLATDEQLDTAIQLSLVPIDAVASSLEGGSAAEQDYFALIDTGFAFSLSRLLTLNTLCYFLLDASVLSDEDYLAQRQELFGQIDQTIDLNYQLVGQLEAMSEIAAGVGTSLALIAIHDVTSSSGGEPIEMISTSPQQLTISANVTNLSALPAPNFSVSILPFMDELETDLNGPGEHVITSLGADETKQLQWDLTFSGSLDLAALPVDLVLDGNPEEMFAPYALSLWIEVFDTEDTDLDGLPDSYEAANNLNPNEPETDGDPDGDGLSNFMEFVLGTDPQKADTDGDGVSDLDEYEAGTDPLDPDLFPTQEKHLYFPFYQGGGGSFSGFAVSNYSQGDVNLEFRAYDATGSLLTSGGNPSDYTLSSENQLARLGHEIFQVSSSTDHKGWVELTADSHQIGSFFLFGSGTQMDGSVAIQEKSKELYFTRIVDGEYTFWGETADTYLAVANPNEQDVTVRLTLMAASELAASEEATLIEEISPLVTSQTIPGKGYLYEDVSELFEADFPIMSGYVMVEVTEGEGVAGFELIVLPEAETAIGLNAASGDDSQTLYSAQLANGPDIFTDLNLINTSNENRVVTAIGIAQDGSELGREQFTLQPGEYMTDDTGFLFDLNLDVTTVGSIQVEADGAGVIGDVIFGEFEVLQYAAALPLQTQTFTEAVFSHVAVTDDLFTGLALYNPGTMTAQATIGVFSPDGEKKGERILELQPGARTSQLVRELVQGLTEQAGGYIVVKSTQPLVAQQLFGMLQLDLLSSVPPTIVH